MSYSKHTIVLNDIQSLVVLDALNALIQNPEKNEDDKNVAQVIRLIINEVVHKDKMPRKEVDLENKCGTCTFARKREFGKMVDCVCPEKNPNFFARTRIACKQYVRKERNE